VPEDVPWLWAITEVLGLDFIGFADFIDFITVMFARTVFFIDFIVSRDESGNSIAVFPVALRSLDGLLQMRRKLPTRLVSRIQLAGNPPEIKLRATG
jgi:hypothetical protein